MSGRGAAFGHGTSGGGHHSVMGRVEGVHHSVLGRTSGGGASFGPGMGRVEGVHHSVLGWGEWRGYIIQS